MNEQQRQNLDKHGTTHPREPDFVLRAAEVQSEADIAAWVRRVLQVGPEGLAEFVAAIRDILSKHGEVCVFIEHRQVGLPEYRPNGVMIITWCRLFVPKPPRETGNSEEGQRGAQHEGNSGTVTHYGN